MAHGSRCYGRGTSRLRSLLAGGVVTFSALSATAQSPTPPLRDVFRRVCPTVVVIANRQRELAPERET